MISLDIYYLWGVGYSGVCETVNLSGPSLVWSMLGTAALLATRLQTALLFFRFTVTAPAQDGRARCRVAQLQERTLRAWALRSTEHLAILSGNSAFCSTWELVTITGQILWSPRRLVRLWDLGMCEERNVYFILNTLVTAESLWKAVSDTRYKWKLNCVLLYAIRPEKTIWRL